ncbi:CMRF35-like molecule 1 [Elgaria multicarinata webbii]|uniref:CMRF35-like molecule 1 n=1 Tax=Elgaria multicarinata webbii TaxID=159646 RepID=UPI002FCD2484
MLQQHLMTGLSFFLLIGFTSALTGPPTVAGFLGGSLSVVCLYPKGYQTYVKYWCQGANWVYCRTVVATKGTEAEVKAGRTLIKDNHARRAFTVTLENLTQQDAGIYWCAIEVIGSDHGFFVNIIVHPEPTTTRPTTTEYFSTITSTPRTTGTTIINPLHNNMILLPIVFLVLVVILVGAILLMWKIKKQKGAKARGDIMQSTAPTQTEGNSSSAAVKSKLRPHRKKTPSQEATNSAGEVDYTSVITTRSPASAPQVPDNTEQVSYAALRFSALDEQPTYANVAFQS